MTTLQKSQSTGLIVSAKERIFSEVLWEIKKGVDPEEPVVGVELIKKLSLGRRTR